MDGKHMTGTEFVKLARFVVENHPQRTIEKWGYVVSGMIQDVLTYKDDVIQIKAAANLENPELETERLENNNPTTMVVESGEIIRHHGEHCYLTKHLESLVDSIDPDFRKGD